jgi:broad-specificity NMP kinase
VKEKGFHEGWDEEWQSWIVDEDRLLDYLEEVINPEGAAADSGKLQIALHAVKLSSKASSLTITTPPCSPNGG